MMADTMLVSRGANSHGTLDLISGSITAGNTYIGTDGNSGTGGFLNVSAADTLRTAK